MELGYTFEEDDLVYQRTNCLTDNTLTYCPGCGHGVVHRITMEAIEELNIQSETIGVASVGCSVFAYDFMDVDMTQAPHGRATAVATGIKRCWPDKYVYTYQGDGDLAAIGTAETIHTCNRGENITIIFVNNGIYGMT
ncbi:MAG: thiamine pyrophosphate-dependent enzyme, partial [Bacteroidales bacterium]|nr:thiamine pyrophosphate-dependent enzyme [Bacteroidales bacterium]